MYRGWGSGLMVRVLCRNTQGCIMTGSKDEGLAEACHDTLDCIVTEELGLGGWAVS